MRELGLRVLRIVVIAVVAAVLFHLLDPFGLGWLLIPIAIVGTLAWTGVRWARVQRVRREQRWADAVLDAGARPAAIAALRSAVDRAPPADPRARSEHLRRVVLLAELLDADGEPEEAAEVLDALDLGAMTAMDAGLVRHGRAVVALRAGDAEGARAALGEAQRTGAAALDLRIELLAAAIDLELGDAERALEAATSVRRRASGDEALTVEARVVRAAALDALGNRAEAVSIVRSLGEEMVEMLVKLGQPRVRGLAEEALART